VHVLSLGRHRDELAQGFRSSADRYLELPDQVSEAHRQIRDLTLDVLVFTDVGMDPLTSALAYSRMAPVQCATWGHPVTTGSPAMDWFVSAEALETEGAEDHYTEKLLRLPRLGVCYDRPAPPTDKLNREAFGVDPRAHLYLCPQSLFKLHPEFDPILAGILRADPQGLVLLLEGKYPNWTNSLQERFARRLPDVASRVRFLPRLSRDRFLALNALADVLLDPVHFGGGNTSYEGFALGVPIVTLPSGFSRGRITYALYRQMGLDDGVVDSPEAYVYRAIRLGTDREYRRVVVERINERSHVLFGDTGGIRALEAFFQEVVSKGP
jgi:predicted O-linked N-acetylglucosamine transferase (SPINDLY family)